MKTITKFIYPAIVALVWLAVLPMAQAVGPDTEGAIPFANNGEGKGVLVNRTSGVWNTGTGYQALNHLTSGNENTATGLRALFNTTTGFHNTASGVYSLYSNVVGEDNTADGWQSLVSNTSGFGNVAIGARALASNTIGALNTAIGRSALENSIDSFNTAVGAYALNQNRGYQNVAVGSAALASNATGLQNTAIGDSALFNNAGSLNTAAGFQALYSNTTGELNAATGLDALFFNTTGAGNTANGYRALFINVTGTGNTAMGAGAGSNITGSGNVCIGQGVSGEAGVNNTTYARNVNTLTQNFSAGVNNYVTVRLSDGRLGNTAVVSSQRYKEDIKPLDKTSQVIYALKPVSFRLKKEFDTTQALGFGLIAEEVEQVDPDLVYRNEKGEVESVRYEMVNAMLLNEFLKEHRTVQVQQKEIDALKAELKEQKALIQKVSDKVELNRPAPQMVKNNQR